MTLIQVSKPDYEKKLHYDMKEPCQECPFKKSTPPERKGLDSEKLLWIMDLMMGGDGCHTCHLTDPRSDCESAQTYAGPLQHCMGFARMMEKSKIRTDVIQRALEHCKVTPEQLKDPENQVHSLRDLASTLENWARKGLENGESS